MSFTSTSIALGGMKGGRRNAGYDKKERSSNRLNYSSPSMCGCPQKTMVSGDKRQEEKKPGKILWRTVQSRLKARGAR